MLRRWGIPIVIGACLAILLRWEYSAGTMNFGSKHPWIFAPGAIGELLVGGVHGGAPTWLQDSAWMIATGAFWMLVARLVTSVIERVARSE